MSSTRYPQPLLDELAARPDLIAFEEGGRQVSRGELLDLIGRFVTALVEAGLTVGCGVAIATAVTPEGFAAQLAAQCVGARVVGLRPGLTEEQLRHIVGEDITLLLADEVGSSPELRAVVGARPVVPVRREPPFEFTAPVPAGQAEELASIALTSGSTGSPKGVATSYGALNRHWSWVPDRWSAQTRELAADYGRFLLFGTLTSAVMQEHLALCLLSGGTAVVPDGLPDFPDVIERLRISACLVTVPRLHRMLDELRERELDLSSLRSMMVAGSALSPRRQAEMFERFGDAARQGYGQTETGMLSVLRQVDVLAWPDAMASVGRPWPGVEVAIRDPAGNPADEGEVWVRSASQLAGYWRDEAETAEVIRDGWVRTRDLGRLDERGYLYLTGRARDVVIVNAIVHYAGPIERLLASHPEVDEAFLVGVPDERTGEAAHAFVTRAGEVDPDPAELRSLVAASLGEASVPSSITVVASVPMTATGKPDKQALRALVG